MTKEQQAQLDNIVASLTAQFEAANEATARIKAMEPNLHKEPVQQKEAAK